MSLTFEQRAYDNYVTSGGSDPCFNAGMSGHCGKNCPAYGSKPECFDGEDDAMEDDE